MTQFDLNLLRNLAVLLHTKSVTTAAKRMRMSQPAMSRSLAELRQIIGDPLLVRTRGGMLLTRRAEELVEPVRHWLYEADRLVCPPVIDLNTLQRRFRIVTTDYGMLSVLRPAIPAIHAVAPGVAIDIKPFNGEIVALLAAGEVDLALSSAEPDRTLVHDRHLFHEKFVCIVRHDHPLAKGAPNHAPTMNELLAWPHISVSIDDEARDPVSRALRERGLERRIVATTPYFAAAQTLLRETDMVLTLPARVARDPAVSGGLHIMPAPEELGGFDYWLTWHTRSHGDPAIQWLVELISEKSRAAAKEEAAREPHVEAFITVDE